MTRRELLRAAAALGYACEPTKGGHLAFRHPSGAVVIAAATPSAPSSWPAALAAMRRALRARGLLPAAAARSKPAACRSRQKHPAPNGTPRPEPRDTQTRLVESVAADGRRVMSGTVHGLPITLCASYEGDRWVWRRQRVEVR